MFICLTRYRKNEEDELDVDGPIYINSDHIIRIIRTTDYVTRLILTDGEFDCEESVDVVCRQLPVAADWITETDKAAA